MKNLSVAILLVLLAACMLFVFSCKNREKGGNDASDTNAEATTAAPEVVISKEELVKQTVDKLASTHSYDGDELRFFSRSPTFHSVWYSYELYAEEEKNMPLNDAVYRRNRIIEDKFKITIAETQCSTKDLTSEMRTLILADDKDMDVFMPPFTVAGVLAGEELFYDLYEIPNLDLSSPWWDQQAVGNLNMYGTLYFTIGDISVIYKVATRGIFFNKGLIEDYSLEMPYELVENNTWTIEKMYEMAQVTAEDINSDGVRDNSDRYGLVFENLSIQTMMNAAGGNICELNANNEIETTFMSDKTQTVLAKLMPVMFDRNTCYNDQSVMYKRNASFVKNERTNIWKDGRSLFYEIGFNNLERFREYDIEFGIVPFPKSDTNDPWHSSFYIDGPSLVCIPITNADLEKTGTVLEALCAESSVTLMPAYYDVCVEGKYTRDNESVAMLDIIFSSRVYDLGVIFKLGGLYGKLQNLAAATSTNVSSSWEACRSAFEADLAKVIDVYS